MRISGFLMVVLLAGSLAAQDTAVISGKVTDSSGAALGAATVHLTAPGQSAPRDASLDGNSDGKFVFSNLPAGTYKLEVSSITLKPFTAEVTVAAGEKKDIPVQLATICATETEDYVGKSAIFLQVDESVTRKGRLFAVRISRNGELEYQGRNGVAIGTKKKQVASADVQALLRSFDRAGFWKSKSCIGDETMHPDVTILGASEGGKKKAVWIYNDEASKSLLVLRDKILAVAKIAAWTEHGQVQEQTKP